MARHSVNFARDMTALEVRGGASRCDKRALRLPQAIPAMTWLPAPSGAVAVN